MGPSRISDLATIIEDLEALGRLVRIRSEVDLKHDLAGIAAKLEGGARHDLSRKKTLNSTCW